ncbi:MAG: hypothetical protein M1817_006440 [Caeruleum heppii]|nr:MAG: hypothetical protein M1817_006440 [Caeruleum heppii]
MPHSPYRKTVHAPLQDLSQHRHDLIQNRVRFEDGENDKFAEEVLLEIGEDLIQQCDFLADKLEIKRRDHDQLVKQNSAMKEEIASLRNESVDQGVKIGMLKAELERMKASTKPEEQLGPNGDGTPQNAEIVEAEKPEEGKGSSETAEVATPHKRSAEKDTAVDEKTAKKRRTKKL